MAKISTVRKNWPKYVLQWGVLLALLAFILAPVIFTKMAAADPEKFCPMGGIQALATYLFRGSLPCSMSSVQIMMGLALAAAVILFSKLFCSFLCPVGTIEDLLTKLHRKLRIKRFNPKNGGVLDCILRVFKYVLLFVVFYMTMTASELFCKNLDPYYAVATGFKGEITLWMSIVTVTCVVLGGLIVDRFWCKYLCPLGAISNTLKFWIWTLVLFAIIWVLSVVNINVPLWIPLAMFCLLGYVLEVAVRKPRFQAIHVMKNESLCNHCGSCERACPYQIAIGSLDGKVNHVDCTLCGECCAVCPTEALHVGVLRTKRNNWWNKLIPAALAVVITVLGMVFGSKFEIPTIDEKWGLEAYDQDSVLVKLVDPSTLKTVEIENLTSVHCYGSSRAFMARLEKIKGVHGVKTYVRSHRAVITYNPAVISVEKLTEEIYVPSHCRIESPDWHEVPEVKVLTIRTEHMPNTSDLNNLANQFRFTYTDKKVYGLDSEYDCPLIVHLYVDPACELTEDELREIVEKKSVDLTNKDGELFKSIPVDFEFVKLESGSRTMDTREYLEMMFDPFLSGSFNGRYTQGDSTYVAPRAEVLKDQQWYVYEYVNQGFEKPLYKRSYPFVSNWLSSEEGVISVDVKLNADYVPALQVTFTEPMTAEKIWEMLSAETWKITYAVDDVREESAKIKFNQEGTVFPLNR